MSLRNKEEILAAVCESFSVTYEQLCNPNRRMISLGNARMAYVQLLHSRLGLSCIQIGALCNRDRRTIHRLLDEHILVYKTDNNYRTKFDDIAGGRKRFECIFTVSETFPNKKKKRGYDGTARRKHMLKLMFDKLVKEGMVTVDAGIDQDYNNIYTTKLNIPRTWLSEQN